MKAVLQKLNTYKWVPFWFFIVESLVLLPFIFFTFSYAHTFVAFDLDVTPFGTVPFTSVLLEGLTISDASSWLIMGFVFTLPLLLITKIALVAGNFHLLEYECRSFSDWLAAAGQHAVKALALFARWLPLPLIWLGLCRALMLIEMDGIKYLAMALFVLGWMMLFSWFNYALIEVVQQKKKSLRTAWQILKSSWLKVMMASLLLLMVAALVNTLPLVNLYLGFSEWGHVATVTVVAILSGLLLRTVIFMWQIAHYINYEKWKGYR
jgi:hypothetical protein